MRSNTLLLLLFFTVGTITAQSGTPISEPATVSIGVLSLFHPRILFLTSAEPLTLSVDSQTVTYPPNQPATLRYTGSGIRFQLPGRPNLMGAKLQTSPGLVTLSVPGKLTRLYRGALAVSVFAGALSPVITMPTEVAVASIVQAEAPPQASLEALEVQAIVSRSFLLARPSAHPGFDSCDTTHCQFLRSPPPLQSPAAIAARATRGIVITWRAGPDATPSIVRAMYSQRCGGHTRKLLTTADSYPFYSVACAFCLREHRVWHRPPMPASGPPRTEGSASPSIEITDGPRFHQATSGKPRGGLRGAA